MAGGGGGGGKTCLIYFKSGDQRQKIIAKYPRIYKRTFEKVWPVGSLRGPVRSCTQSAQFRCLRFWPVFLSCKAKYDFTIPGPWDAGYRDNTAQLGRSVRGLHRVCRARPPELAGGHSGPHGERHKPSQHGDAARVHPGSYWLHLSGHCKSSLQIHPSFVMIQVNFHNFCLTTATSYNMIKFVDMMTLIKYSIQYNSEVLIDIVIV